jgi:hypothetical protein
MQTFQIFNHTFLVDRGETKRVYSRIDAGSSQMCECVYCRHYLQNREAIFPPELNELLDKLGIDVEKDYEVVYLGPEPDGYLLYSIFFDFKGTVIAIPHDENIHEYKEFAPNIWMRFSEVENPVESHFDRFGNTVVQIDIMLRMQNTVEGITS